MRIILFFFLFILLSRSLSASDKIQFSPVSHHSEKKRFKEFRFEAAADMISGLNSVVSKKNFEINSSGELFFKRRFGILVHVDAEKEKSDNNKSQYMSCFAEFRWYFECDCYAAAHAGIYSGLSNKTTFIEKSLSKLTGRTNIESGFENGLIGGYKAMLSDSWSVDPIVSAGISSLSEIKSTETYGSIATHRTDFIMRIMLNVGFRF